MTPLVVPLHATVALAHAELQVLAEDQGVDLLHIKGPALDPSLLRPWPDDGTGSPRASIDADVLVRPSHVGRLLSTLETNGWRCLYDFADGSAFEHAATWARDDLSSVDVHRYFPGIERDAERAFDALWSDRSHQMIAGVDCTVPSLPAQRLIVLIHAARGRGPRSAADRERAWFALERHDREEIDALADELGARVALRAGTGRLESVRGERTYPLWRHLTTSDGSLLGLWWARVRSAPDARTAVRVGVRMLVPNAHRMETQLGRPPTRRELASAYRRRMVFGVSTLRRWASSRVGVQR